MKENDLRGADEIELEKVLASMPLRVWRSDDVVPLGAHPNDPLATHPEGPYAVPITNQYVRWGSSPRGAQTLVLAAKVRALLDGRFNVSFEDLRRVYLPALRHRTLLNFEAQAEGISTDDVLLKVLDAVPEKAEDRVAARAG